MNPSVLSHSQHLGMATASPGFILSAASLQILTDTAEAPFQLSLLMVEQTLLPQPFLVRDAEVP